MEKLGGDVAYDYQIHGKLLDRLATPPGPELLRKWLGTDIFANVEYLVFDSSSVPASPPLTDASLQVLVGLPRLRAVGRQCGNDRRRVAELHRPIVET